MSHPKPEFNLTCPLPIQKYPKVLLAHGSGGRLMHQLISGMFLATFGKRPAKEEHDAAVFQVPCKRLAFTTDSYVVRPLFFPGGDIGTLAVNGTVNDLAMAGARPAYLSLGFILEEGLEMETLWRVVQSIHKASLQAGVEIVTGDTKVVDKGKGDGLFINTSGVGWIEHGLGISPASVRPGDKILLNGDIARHGISIMAVREGLSFESEIESDTAPLDGIVQALLDAGVEIHCLRDLTRGGMASTLNEIAEAAGVGIRIEEKAILVREDVRAACELLGLDPLYVANEGRFVAMVAAEDVGRALEVMRKHPLGKDAALVGEVVAEASSGVVLKSKIGASRVVDMITGELLPRIC